VKNSGLYNGSWNSHFTPILIDVIKVVWRLSHSSEGFPQEDPSNDSFLLASMVT
jgi:hypothetical protein